MLGMTSANVWNIASSSETKRVVVVIASSIVVNDVVENLKRKCSRNVTENVHQLHCCMTTCLIVAELRHCI